MTTTTPRVWLWRGRCLRTRAGVYSDRVRDSKGRAVASIKQTGGRALEVRPLRRLGPLQANKVAVLAYVLARQLPGWTVSGPPENPKQKTYPLVAISGGGVEYVYDPAGKEAIGHVTQTGFDALEIFRFMGGSTPLNVSRRGIQNLARDLRRYGWTVHIKWYGHLKSAANARDVARTRKRAAERAAA